MAPAHSQHSNCQQAEGCQQLRHVVLGSEKSSNTTGWKLPEPEIRLWLLSDHNLGIVTKTELRWRQKTEDEDIGLETSVSLGLGGGVLVWTPRVLNESQWGTSYHLVNCSYWIVYQRVMSLVSALLNIHRIACSRTARFAVGASHPLESR